MKHPRRRGGLDISRPAIIIEDRDRCDLGVIRSLGFYGIPVHLLVPHARSIAGSSRYVTATHQIPPNDAPDSKRLRRIVEIADRLPDRPVALATGDRWLEFFSRHREELTQVLDLDLADHDTIQNCVEKDRFSHIAANLGLPIPWSFAPSRIEEIQHCAETFPYPVFVKPARHEDWSDLPAGVVKHLKGQRIDSAAELKSLYARLVQHGAMRTVIQRFVQGADSGHVSVHAYVDPSGRLVGAFSGKKLRVWPPHRGIGSHAVSTRLPEVIQTATDIIAKLDYRGFALLQFKRDSQRDVYELLEINCRHSTWAELPSRCNANFPVVAYAVMTGQEPPEIRQREGIAWLDFERDIAALGEYRRSGDWTWTEYLRSLRSVRCWAFFAWDDPTPFFRMLLHRLMRKLGFRR